MRPNGSADGRLPRKPNSSTILSGAIGCCAAATTRVQQAVRPLDGIGPSDGFRKRDRFREGDGLRKRNRFREGDGLGKCERDPSFAVVGDPRQSFRTIHHRAGASAEQSQHYSI